MHSYSIDLDLRDRQKLALAIREERRYFNALLAALSGPIRTMPETILSFAGRKEGLLGELAATRYEITRRRPSDPVPAGLMDYIDMISHLDMRSGIILDAVTVMAEIEPQVRRMMAMAMIRYAREQVQLMAKAETNPRQAIVTITPGDERTKRHIQLPRSILDVTFERRQMRVQVPYFGSPIVVPAPQTGWTHMILRAENERTTMLLSNDVDYDLRRFDSGRPGGARRANAG